MRPVGAQIVASADEIYRRAELIVKVKEPQPPEIARLREGQIVFCYFHFAAARALTAACLKAGITAVAYETLQDPQGRLPLLTPMSEIAGRMSIQEGAKCLERPMMGQGILLGGVPGVAPANVLVLGGGIVGTNAARMAAGLAANVAIMDINLDRLRYLDEVMPANVTTIYSDPHTIEDYAVRADLIIGAVLIPGGRAPDPDPPHPAEEDEARQRDRGCLHRPGRLHGDVPPHHAQRPDLHRGRRRALLRDQYPGCRQPDLDPGPVQRHAALRPPARLAGRATPSPPSTPATPPPSTWPTTSSSTKPSPRPSLTCRAHSTRHHRVASPSAFGA